jgi:hypothetical protein
MPTVIAESDSFAATMQRPNNGELADAGSLLTPLQVAANSRRYLYNRTRGGLFDVVRAPYNADPTGGVSSQAAFDAAIGAAAAAGGDVIIGTAGTYLYTGLSVPQGVNIYAVPGVYLAMNHATANAVVFTDPNDGPPSVICGIRFIGNVVNTGTGVVNNADARGIFERCTWNGFASGGGASNNLQGKIASLNSADSKLLFIDCDIKVVGNVRGIDVTLGYAGLVRGSLTMPQSYSQALLYAASGGDADMSRVKVDCSAHSVGTASAFAAIARGRMLGCKVNGQVAIATTGFLWEEGARVVAKGNDWDMSAFFNPYGPNLAGVDSHVDLLPALAINTGAVTAIDSSVVGSRAYASVLVRNGATAPTTIDLLPGIVPGQIKHFTYFNDTISAMTVSFVGTPLTAQALPGSGTLGAGNTLSGTFAWENRDVGSSLSYRWVQKGTWGVGLTLV